jgi:MoaA/NifB/PqqE/SkfB family radical SAM enzyme
MSHFSYYIEMSRRLHLQTAPKIWNYIKYRSMAREPFMSSKRYTPQIGTLSLTVRCNLNCGYCNAAKIRQEGKINLQESEATLEKVKCILANPFFTNCLFFDLGGGEPLLVEDLDKIVAYMGTNGHITNVITNGLLLNDRIADLKNAGISRISISLYDENLSVMQNSLEKINKVFPTHASIVLLRSAIEKNPDKLLDMVRLTHNTGCVSMRFFMYRPMGINPQLEEIISDTNPAYIEFHRKLENTFPGFCLWPEIVKTGKVKKLCPQLWQRVGCDMLGNIIICCGIDNTLKGKNSNLFENKPEIIFNHPALVAMRRQLMAPNCEPPHACKNCNLLGNPGW